ncbi:MAG TPA: DUF1501 domain-containing protein [Polyangia bacterium]|nr:DUF1501 domain-containing protein [Polyangia bacterium]
MITRRQTLKTTLFGAGLVGLRALATGLPPSFLLNPRRAFAGGAAPVCGSNAKAQYILFNTSGNGDPINANVPGTYEDPNIVHSADTSMAATPLTLNGTSTTAAAPWATLPQNVLDRTCFWHLMTNTPVHPEEPNVLKLMGVTASGEMLPSLLARELAPCLGTIQAQPICMGATSPSEGISFGGAPLPIVPALALKATLTSAPGALTNLQALRDQTMNQLYDLYRNGASPAQQAFVDSLVTSQQQVRSINQNLLSTLGSITDNSPASQILAAITLIQMKVSPVISVHIPFGGDNHRDVGLAAETAQTVSGVATIASLMQQLAAAGLADQVTLMSLDVFGRTIGPGNTDGRQHNPNHQVSFTIGKPFKGGIIGGVAPVGTDYGALAIDSKTGAASTSGDVSPVASLAAFGQTMLAAVGVASAEIASDVGSGTVISGALA